MTASSTTDASRHYLRWFFGTVMAAVLLAGAINVLVDPLGIFMSPRMQGVNRIKPHLDHHQELTRWRQVQRLCPSAMILGNSRAEIGFDPEHPAFATRGLNVANQAVPGTDVVTAYHQVLWSRSIGCTPKLLVIGIEFFDFLGDKPPRSLALLSEAPAPRIDTKAWTEIVFSVSGLSDSLTTVAVQQARHPATLTERGFNPMLNYVPEVARSGHHALFRQRAVENARVWARKPRLLRPPGADRSEDAVALQAILDIARASGSQVHLVIYPYHAQIRLMMKQLALDGLFRDWKRDMLAMTELAAGRAGAGAVSLWDFSGLSHYTTEVIPPPTDRHTQLQHYWEAGHFKKALGDKVLSRVLGQASDFGIQLDRTMLEPWLAQDARDVDGLCKSPTVLCTFTADTLRQAGVAAPR